MLNEIITYVGFVAILCYMAAEYFGDDNGTF